MQGQTNVISWKPTLSYSGAVLNANDMQSNGYQRVSGDEQKGVFQQQNTASFQETFGYTYSPSVFSTPYKDPASDLTYFCSDTMPNEVTGSSVRSRPAPSSSPYAGLNPPLNSHLRSWAESNSGELTVMGDPNIQPLTNGNLTLVDVVCYKPSGTMGSPTSSKVLHYSSGLYQISSVDHLITAGSYQTVLHLERAASPSP